jgi:hypothetical protein
MADSEHPTDGTGVAVSDGEPAAEEPGGVEQPSGDQGALTRLSVRRGDWPVSGTVRRQLAGVLLVVLALGAILCGALASDDQSEPPDADVQRAAARDDTREGMTRAVETLMTADHREAAETFTQWSSVTTGRLHARIADQKNSIMKKLRTTREVTTASTVEAALTSWDDAAGTAQLLSVVEVTATSAKEKDATRTVRYLALAQRVDGQWLLSALQQLGAVS